MTVPIYFLLTLAIVLKVDIAGSFDDGYNMNQTPTTNRVRARGKYLPSKLISLNKINNRIFTDTLRGDIFKRVKREGLEDRCATFHSSLTHPHPINDTKYYRDIDCVTEIKGAEGTILSLKFVDFFDIEYHPNCEYDYLEIRDGTRGYANLLGGRKLCGQQFPGPINTTGPHAWLKFHSDQTIEQEGFKIIVTEIQSAKSHVVPESCDIKISGDTGLLDINTITQKCKDDSANKALEVLWTIEAEENHMIALNFTKFGLTEPNSCKDNVVQVFGTVIEFDSRLAQFCGTIAEPVTTIVDDLKGEVGNVMHVRFFASKATKDSQKFNARYTVFRKLDTSDTNDVCAKGEEFDCQDGTCISLSLTCDDYANCKLKADEQPELCKGEIDVFNNDIQVIVIILSLIVSGMILVFLFKCFRKLYSDQKIIKENLQNTMENGLDVLSEMRLALDERSERDSQPDAFLEKEKENLIKQSKPKHKQSMDSIFDQDSRFESDIVLWRKEVDSVPDAEIVKIGQNGTNGKTKRSDVSKKEESFRIKRDEKDKKERKEPSLEEQNSKIAHKKEDSSRSREQDKSKKKEVSIGTADVKEFGCQTRESLFLTDPPRSSVGSSSKSRGLSTVVFSEAEPSPPSPPQMTASEITIELLHKVTPEGPVKTQKKTPECRRPMSAETTRSAPDVIVLAKPIGGDF